MAFFQIAQIKLNAKTLEKKFIAHGYTLMFGGTDNHLLLINTVASKNIPGKEAQIALDSAGITVNKNMIPDDQRKPMNPSGIRLGTPAITTRGMKEPEMELIADMINDAVTHSTDEKKLYDVRSCVIELTKRFPLYENLTY